MLVYIDDREDEEFNDDCTYGYDYGSEEENCSYEYDSEKQSYNYEENNESYFD